MNRCFWIFMVMVLCVSIAFSFVACGGDEVAPMADAGPDQKVDVGTEVTLDGSGSRDYYENTLYYDWDCISQPALSSISYTFNIVDPKFTPNVKGDYTFSLRVDNDYIQSPPDTVLIRAIGNAIPIAFIGPDQVVATGATVQLNGSPSYDPDLDPITYLWTMTVPTGSAAVLSNATIVNPTFTTDLDGQYEVTLVVNDGSADSAAVKVIITAQ
ncbi:MAG: PKD domain-containing protein [Planctomycetota bacterium]|jgi:hypothetical protein